MRSLGRTLVLGTTTGTAAVFAAAGILLYLLAGASLLARFDESLLDKARLLASAVEWERGGFSMEFDNLDMHELEGDHPAGYLQLWRADGSTLYKSPGLAEDSLERPAERLMTPAWRSAQLPDGRPGRTVSFAFLPRAEDEKSDGRAEGGHDGKKVAPQSAETISLAFARNTDLMHETLARLRWLLLLVGMVSITMSTSVLWWLVRRSMCPLESLAREIGQVDANDLSKPIGREACPSEIRPVIDRLNDLLVRLDAAFRRERAFSANVAHELRNPLAALCLKMDVARSRTRQPQEYEQAIDQCRQITTQIQRIVENLLSLARLEAGQIVARAEPMCLDELIRELWRPLEVEAARRRLDVQWSMTPPLLLVSDASLVSLVARNVLENAVAHVNDGGAVRIGASSTNGAVEILVANSGSRLSQDQAEHAFEQFWRGDEARSNLGVHCGLGLSLVGKIVTVLGGTARVRSCVDGDFEILIAFLSRTTKSGE
jgi:two-component system, OmpR family, heavy metal sensor histidine kinase CusS